MIFSRIKLMAIAGTASLAIGFGGGWMTRDAFADAAKTKALETSIDRLVERENTLRTDIADRALADLESAREQADYQDRLEANIRSLENEIDEVAEVQSDLRLSAGYVSLLNDAITGVDRPGSVPDPSGASPYADSGASSVDFAELTRWQLATVEQYKTIWQQCNALIDWNVENMVETQEEE